MLHDKFHRFHTAKQNKKIQGMSYTFFVYCFTFSVTHCERAQILRAVLIGCFVIVFRHTLFFPFGVDRQIASSVNQDVLCLNHVLDRMEWLTKKQLWFLRIPISVMSFKYVGTFNAIKSSNNHSFILIFILQWKHYYCSMVIAFKWIYLSNMHLCRPIFT